ncbi:U3 small nucleolar RNA-associated protein 25 [Metschnikowia bicuspidata var. bicuspidata NRRL YB-4993]|uniref:U3 small nucleolar RNA-associated protein 25 n=1 Tax=Metschnikowia bicuspidata var. bicuspidata NRRL YB-4993 TaxID=869754 RepID=A0A1A0HAR9_9ASCO|nr:U3 small nucleolar RNA-associated protein 25 [Metschnikowia bicuspidata var. bicuspidata NRRL YB-4993]OBA21090.1 U3 small nucleolar RNA-associated protein 25 [Metschnikowia bicuspidata var. bicuspidata NRRL YB-4993]
MAPPKHPATRAKNPGAGAKKHRPNHGRQQLRHVTRTARRPAPAAEDAVEPASLLEDELAAPATAAPAPPKFQEGKAYDALLTLLTAEQKTAPIRRRSPEQRRTDRPLAPGADDDINAGANLADDPDSDTDSDAGASSDADDAPGAAPACDPFEAHFNLVSDSAIELKSKAAAGHKWPLAERTEFGSPAYVAQVHEPPGGALGSGRVDGGGLFSSFATVKNRVRAGYLAQHGDALTALDAAVLRRMLEYRDVSFACQLHTNTAYQKLYIAHVLNHTFKTRDRILKNNDKLRAYGDALRNGTLAPGAAEPELRDQGFTRPKALILLPTRHAAYEVVEQLIRLSGAEQQENRRKFKLQFFQDGMPPETKPADFRRMFQGNSSDFFSVGIKFTRKTVKLYASFFNADVLVASPLGLSMILEDPKQAKREYDFLSSIEVLVVDHANQIEMQNWDHVATVLRYVNRIPKNSHGADFSRIRMWAINDQARYLRQTLVFCEFLTPNVNSMLSRSANLAGKARFRPVVTAQTCIMNSVGLKIKQIFQRFDAPDPQTSHDARFKFFVNAVLPAVTKQLSYEDGLLIYIPSYFDYVRVKAHMKRHTKLDFASIDEYLSRPKVSRARHHFAAGKTKLLLYTERLHHFRRYELAGVKNVLVYEAPANPQFYKELLRFVGKSIYNGQADVDLSFVKTLYSKWDAAALERIVGNERTPVLCNAVNELYEFR